MTPGPRPAGRSVGRPVVLAGAAAVIVAVAVSVGVATRWGGGGRPVPEVDRHPAPPLAVTDRSTWGAVTVDSDAGRVPGPDVEVDLTVPNGATGMQVGTDPTFVDATWSPTATRATVTVHDHGYQMVYARFRRPDGTATGVSVAGVTIDPTWSAAVSSADGEQQASWVRPLSPTAIVVRVEAGRLRRGAQQAYDLDRPLAGDRVTRADDGRRIVERDGRPWAVEVFGHPDLVRPYDTLIGRPLDGGALTAGDWSVSVGAGDEVTVSAVERISRPAGSGTGPGGEPVVPVVHDVVVTLASPLGAGARVRVEPPDGLVAPIEASFDPTVTISPLVHVNQNGHDPDDPLKVGYVSGLLGGIGGLDAVDLDGREFQVIDTTGGEVVHRGAASARPGGDELGRGDLSGAPAWELDFSAVTTEGRYRVCVDDVGCSEAFDIDRAVWRDLAVTVARAMYHQRSGVALGEPYTAIGRPRPYHPDDGVTVTASELTRWESDGSAELFGDLVGGDTGRVVAGAWGGHFDAGDWDRRIQHLYYVRAAAELLEADPGTWAGLDLDIPESGDAVPDLLDEGLWTLDLFLRLQRDDGAVPGGIEAAEHPQPDATSWTEALSVHRFAPDTSSTLIHAAVAAQVAAVLEPYDPERAGTYLESAEAAMAWATANPERGRPEGLDEAGDTWLSALVLAQRSTAAIALYKATGDARWHDEFLATTTLTDGVDDRLACHEHGACDAAWIYLTLPPHLADPGVRAIVADSVTATADAVLAAAATTTYGWTLDHPDVPLVWGLGVGGAPKTTALVRAWIETGDTRYRSGALRSAAVSLGANPLNAVYLTGVGATPVTDPLIVDTTNGGLPVWPGTPVYGNHRTGVVGDDSWIDTWLLEPAGITPLGADAPYLWQWYDLTGAAVYDEFTVFQSHAVALSTFGLLAAGDRWLG